MPPIVLSAPLGFGTRHDSGQNYDIYDLGKSSNSITLIFDYGNGNLFYQGYLRDGTEAIHTRAVPIRLHKALFHSQDRQHNHR